MVKWKVRPPLTLTPFPLTFHSRAEANPDVKKKKSEIEARVSVISSHLFIL